MRSLAVLDAILSPDWEFRYWSFNKHWDDEMSMGSMRDGSGDEMFAVFSTSGALLKGFSHESPMSPYRINPPSIWPGVVEDVPPVFADVLSEPALSPGDLTFCIWRLYGDAAWQHGDIAYPEGTDPDGSANLLSYLDDSPQTYHAWAEYYWEQSVSLAAVEHIYSQLPITTEVISSLNQSIDLKALDRELAEIGYPRAG